MAAGSTRSLEGEQAPETLGPARAVLQGTLGGQGPNGRGDHGAARRGPWLEATVLRRGGPRAPGRQPRVVPEGQRGGRQAPELHPRVVPEGSKEGGMPQGCFFG